MTSDQLHDALDELGMKPDEMAVTLGVAPRTFRDWLAGTTRVPGPATKLVRLMLDRKVFPDEVRAVPCSRPTDVAA